MIRRNIYSTLVSHLDQPEITLITGPRQVGKTTLMRRMAGELAAGGKPCLFLQLDNEADFRVLATQESLIARIRQTSADRKVFVFIDEIQLMQPPSSGRLNKNRLYSKGEKE
jgi:predicted AAA+ superfamily ATPase